jgi:hypothetical protein
MNRVQRHVFMAMKTNTTQSRLLGAEEQYEPGHTGRCDGLLVCYAVQKTTLCGGHQHKSFLHTNIQIYKKKKTPWSESASELYRPSDRRLSAK